MEDFDYLLKQFNDATLPKSSWTHEAHLLVGLWYVKQYPFYDAVCRLKAGIIKLNNFHGTANHGASGYHETFTVFWLKILALYRELNPQQDFAGLAAGFLRSGLASRELPFTFYVKEEVLSPAFRAIFHEPTLARLDTTTIKSIFQVAPLLSNI